MKLDEIDFKILGFLRKNARISYTEIGNALRIADSTVHIRIKKMMDEGIINRFTVNVNNEALGSVTCLLMLDVVPGHFEEVVPSLIQSENVEDIYETQGQHIAILKISANNLTEIRDEIVRIRKIPNVTESEMCIILKIWKNT
jgi:Lrp/AsnC family transcriptional regulator for asnA, asnC and gidA